MSVARRVFIKSVTLTTISAGVLVSAAKLIFGQGPFRTGNEQPIMKPQPAPINASDFTIPIEAQADPVFFFTAETFIPYLGDSFTVPSSFGRTILLRLEKVTPYKVKQVTRITTRKTRQPVSFSLAFTSEERLPQFSSIHKISHQALGDFELFLSSSEIDGGIFVHEAVFNHLR